MKVIIDYPDDFPISEPLRTVFTERLYMFFEVRRPSWYLHHGEILEKLFMLRQEMQKSIGYPPAIPHSPVPYHSPEAYLEEPRPSPWHAPKERPTLVASRSSESIEDILSPEELLCWKSLEFLYLNDLPPDASDAGLEMASRIFGIHIYYDKTNGTVSDAVTADGGTNTQWTIDQIADALIPSPPVSSDPSVRTPEVAPLQLCSFSLPKRIGTLTKYWSHEDRKRLTHTIKHHIEVTALGAFVIGLVFGFLIDATNGHAARYEELSGQQPVPQVTYTHPARLIPFIPVHQNDKVQPLAGVQPPCHFVTVVT
ncbi:hypothetical protein HMI48_05210 [Acidithiobacillus ferrooxidans]|uniref:hypothetical protein n=1 Tax=Acidithiobacillus ferrooxidans TaxID=920 RepID=UPI001C0727E1|nr:hypothetical protein [Acidithiobacillus ferrooxidans]MBU2773324.1 hypothetical protein [Acidithiobacillus ferrooxidans]